MNRVPQGTAVLIYAGKSRPMSQDTDYRFLVDRNFYYLTGIEIQDCKLVMVKGDDDVATVKLFAPEHNELKERWTGKRMDYEKIAAISLIPEENILPLEEFEEYLYELKQNGAKLASDGTSIMDDTKILLASNDVEVTDIGSILTKMRMVKQPEEIEAIKAAARITEAALEEMKSHIRPGVTELELYTALEYGMSKRGSLIPAFSTITAVGDNAFYLHHSEPEGEDGETAKDGGQIQVDVGARVDGYCADISRTYFVGKPVGDDDKRIKLHGLIKQLRAKAWEFIKPGETFKSLNEAMKAIVGPWLVKQNLLEEGYSDDDIKGFYWHNTSHHLGLDVHDISEREAEFEAGNCLAVEPGVYIKQWHVGFRIEDDIVVTDDGCELLSSGMDDIEGIIIE